MRSNGVGHLCNDTFIAATREETNNTFLVTSRLVEERVTPYSLARRVRFVPFSELSFINDGSETHSSEKIKNDMLIDDFQQNDPHDVRHSFHTSVDGKLLASISTGKRKHYLIDVQSASVCEFKTNGIVVSVAWHPTNKMRLLLLLNTGTLLVLAANTTRLEVTFDDKREVQLASIIAKVRDYIFSKNDTCFAVKKESKLQMLEYNKTPLMLGSLKMAKLKASDDADKKDVDSVSFHVKQGGKTSSNNIREAIKEMKDNNKDDKVIAAPASLDVGLTSQGNEAFDTDTNSHQCSLIGMCIVPASLSLSAMLLVLSLWGDIFSVKIDNDGIPVPLSKEYDGRIDVTLDKDYLQHCELNSFPSVHYLVRGRCAVDVDAGGEYPLAIGTTRLDEDVGYHGVFVLYSSGILRGNWFCEPDLLCRNHMRERVDFTIHLDSVLPPFTPTPHIPSVAHLVTLETCGNATLIRYDRTAYLCVWPTWSRNGACWVHREEGTDGCQRVPVAGRGVELPPPVVTRLPYDVTGASLGIGVNDILIFPEVLTADYSAEGDMFCPRSKVIVTKIANLILSALYARGENYILTFNINTDHQQEKNDIDSDSNESDKQKDNEMAEREKNCTKDYSCLENLLKLTAECHRQWICGYPHDAIDGAVGDLSDAVKNVNVKLLQRWSALQEREERLSARVRHLLQKQERLSRTIADSQTDIRDAVVHRSGVAMLETANNYLGKTHKLLNELEALAAERKEKEKGKLVINARGD